MECVKGCEFIRFDGIKKFRCEYYGKDLQIFTKMTDEICILRCDECIENGIPKVSRLATIRENIGQTNGEFYAFKQKFEETMVSILELLQKLEDNHEEKLELLHKLEEDK